MKKKEIKLPKNFFSQSRPKVSNKQTFDDVIPVKWSKQVINGSKKATVYLKNGKV